jgi:hypothetical protein
MRKDFLSMGFFIGVLLIVTPAFALSHTGWGSLDMTSLAFRSV